MRFLSGPLALLMAMTLAAQTVPGGLNLVVVEGDGAINNVHQRTAREPVVQVQDENHKPVAGAAVVFTLPSNGASGEFVNGARTLTVMTDNEGRAAARFQPNTVKGKFQIRVNASQNGRTASVTISQTNVVAAAGAAGAAAAGVSVKLIAIVVAVAGAAAAGGVVAATRGGGSTTTTAAAPVTITPGTGTVGAPK